LKRRSTAAPTAQTGPVTPSLRTTSLCDIRGNSAALISGATASCRSKLADLCTNHWYRCLMSTNTSISLDDHFVSFLAEQVSEGRYRSASEVVRAGLRLLEEKEVQLAALREALLAGEASGEAEVFDFDAFIAEKKS